MDQDFGTPRNVAHLDHAVVLSAHDLGCGQIEFARTDCFEPKRIGASRDTAMRASCGTFQHIAAQGMGEREFADAAIGVLGEARERNQLSERWENEKVIAYLIRRALLVPNAAHVETENVAWAMR